MQAPGTLLTTVYLFLCRLACVRNAPCRRLAWPPFRDAKRAFVNPVFVSAGGVRHERTYGLARFHKLTTTSLLVACHGVRPYAGSRAILNRSADTLFPDTR